MMPTASDSRVAVAGAPLSVREQRIASALAAAAIPPGRFLEGGGEGTAAKFARWVEGASSTQVNAIRALLWAAELAAVPATGRPLSVLRIERAARFVEA